MKVLGILFFVVACSARQIHPKPVLIGQALLDGTFNYSAANVGIIGGDDANIADYPYQLSLSTSKSSSSSHTCGAVLIDPKWALTAAHCVDGASTTSRFIYYGSSKRIGNDKEVDIKEITMHPDYMKGTDQGSFPNDIAVLELAQTLTDPNASPVDLPESEEDFDGDDCVISGWGYTTEGGGISLPDNLQYADVKALSRQECTDIWGDSYGEDVNICLTGPGRGACNGDSGGPMVCSKCLAGLTSFGIVGCDTDYPSVYVRVSHYVDWIKEIMGERR